MTAASLKDLQYEDLKYSGWKKAETSLTFDGGTTNDPGDFDGTGNPSTLFTVTGAVEVKFLCYCTDTLTGASATIEVGTAKTTAGLIAQTTAANIVVNEIWHDATPDASIEATTILATTALGQKTVIQDIICTVGTANITAGTLKFVCLWRPLTEDGKVVSA